MWTTSKRITHFVPRTLWYFSNLMGDKTKEPRSQFLIPNSGQLWAVTGVVVLSCSGLLGILATTIVARVVPHWILCSPDNSMCNGLIYPGSWSDIRQDMLPLILLAIANVAIVFTVTVIFSHQIFGPMVNINRHLDELIKGNFSSRIKLRSGDRFQELASKLNALAATLDEEHSVPQKSLR